MLTDLSESTCHTCRQSNAQLHLYVFVGENASWRYKERMEAARILHRLVFESQQILQRHEGAHTMHACAAAIAGWQTFEPDEIDWPCVELAIRQMRVYDKTGSFGRDLQMKDHVEPGSI